MFYSIALGKRIKNIRQQKGLSQSALSRIANTSQSRLSELERGNISILNICKLNTIAQALETNLDELLYDSLDVFRDIDSIYQLKLNALLSTLEKEDIDFFNHVVDSLIEYKKI